MINESINKYDFRLRYYLIPLYYKLPVSAAHSTTTLEDHLLLSARPSRIACRFPPERNFLSMPWIASFSAPFRGQHFTHILKPNGTTVLLKQFSVSTVLQCQKHLIRHWKAASSWHEAGRTSQEITPLILSVISEQAGDHGLNHFYSRKSL